MKTAPWAVEFAPAAVDDLEQLDGSVRPRLVGAIQRLNRDPLNYGKPLGNRCGMDLVGLRELRCGPYRVVYCGDERTRRVLVLVIGKRERLAALKEADRRIRLYRDWAEEEVRKAGELLREVRQS